MHPVNKSLIPINLSSIFEPLKIEAYLEANEDESHFYDTFSNLIKAQFDLGLPFILALVKDIGSSALYCFEAEKLKEWAKAHETNPLTNSKIERIFQFTINSNKNYHFNYSGEWDLKEGKLILGKNLKVSGNKSFMKIEGDYKMFSLSPLITYLFVDINDCVYIPSTEKKITFSNIIALQKKKNIPYIFAAVKDKNLDKISFFETSNFQTSKINPVTNQEIDKLIYCMLKLDQTQKTVINYIGAQQEIGDKKCFLDTCFKATSGNVEAQYMLGTYNSQGKGVAQNLSEAYKWFKIAAEADHREAQFELGICYNEGKGIKKDCKKAITYFTNAAKKNYIEAIYQLGLNHWNGQGVVKDLKLAGQFFLLAKEEGHELAKKKFDDWWENAPGKEEGQIPYYLGLRYFKGDYIEKNIEKALQFLIQAAELEYSFANVELGIYYLGVGKLEMGITWLKKGSDLEDMYAQYQLGTCYCNGVGVAQDIKKAAYYFELSANQGCLNAQDMISFNYLEGSGVEQNFEKAVYYLKLSAAQGSKTAQYRLALHYKKGVGVDKDFKETIKWLTFAAKQGFAAAEYKLGFYYFNGTGVKQNYKLAANYYELAAEKGYDKAQFKLGLCYEKGEGVKQNDELSLKYLMLSADQNYVHALHKMGVNYANGQGVPKNLTFAVKYFTAGSEQNSAACMYELAICYNDGLGVPINEELGQKYWRQAAEKGHKEAQFNLGIHFFKKGSQEDIADGTHYIKLAADQGHKGAKTFLKISK